MALKEQCIGHAVPRDVRGGDAIPAAMLDGDAGFGADGLEADLDLGALVFFEAGLAPGEGDQRVRLPLRDAADLEGRSVRISFCEAPAR